MAGLALLCLVTGCAGATRVTTSGSSGVRPGRLQMLTEDSLQDFRGRFNEAGGTLRYIAVFSPT